MKTNDKINNDVKPVIEIQNDSDSDSSLGHSTPTSKDDDNSSQSSKELIETTKPDTLNQSLKDFFEAAKQGNVEMVKMLLDSKKIGVNDKGTVLSKTALHFAVKNGDINLMQILINDYGADVNAQDKFGATPLYDGAACDQDKAVSMLLKNGADPNIVDVHNDTPLTMAVVSNNLLMMKEMMDHKADVHIVGKDNFSLLHVAAQGIGHHEDWEVVRLLLQEKLDPLAINDLDMSVIDYFYNSADSYGEQYLNLLDEMGL